MGVVPFFGTGLELLVVLGIPIGRLALLPSSHVREVHFLPFGGLFGCFRERSFGPCWALFREFSSEIVIGIHAVTVVVAVVVIVVVVVTWYR